MYTRNIYDRPKADAFYRITWHRDDSLDFNREYHSPGVTQKIWAQCIRNILFASPNVFHSPVTSQIYNEVGGLDHDFMI